MKTEKSTIKKENKAYARDTHERFLIWRNLKLKHKLNLTEEQLDVIDRVYFGAQIDERRIAGTYRLVNMIFGILAIIFWIIFEGQFREWIFLILTISFTFINIFYGIRAKLMIRKLKERHEAIKNV